MDRCMPPSIGSPVMVDGVVYSQKRIREIVHERHQMALEIRELERRLERADRLLRLRTSALTRLIARKGPHFGPGGHVTISQPTVPSERPVPEPPKATRRGW